MEEIEIDLDDPGPICDECHASEVEDIINDSHTGEWRGMFRCECGFVVCEKCKDSHTCH